MKPQCTTSADCLRELARVMDQFGITDVETVATSKYVKYYGASWIATERCTIPHFSEPGRWQFAIAEVEGKPVFIGDELYSPEGKKFLATEMETMFHLASWLPQKPKTVMVEMLVEDARYVANTGAISLQMVAACKKALEKA